RHADRLHDDATRKEGNLGRRMRRRLARSHRHGIGCHLGSAAVALEGRNRSVTETVGGRPSTERHVRGHDGHSKSSLPHGREPCPAALDESTDGTSDNGRSHMFELLLLLLVLLSWPLSCQLSPAATRQLTPLGAVSNIDQVLASSLLRTSSRRPSLVSATEAGCS